MTIAFQNLPTYENPIINRGPDRNSSGNTNSIWYRFFQGSFQGIAPGPESAVALPASPALYTAPSKGFVIVSGGTVSAIQFTRIGTYLLPVTSGVLPVSKGDMLTITYTVLPTVVFVPQ